MTTSEFVGLVEKMRSLQRDYFRTKNPFIMHKSMMLEMEVDDAVRLYKKPKDTQREMPLEADNE